jgi:hypothetical protein
MQPFLRKMWNLLILEVQVGVGIWIKQDGTFVIVTLGLSLSLA